MASESQDALSEGIAVAHEQWDMPYRVGAVGGPTFAAILSSKATPDALGGTVTETTLQVTRATLATLPASGAIITETGSGNTYTVMGYRDGPPGEIFIVVEAETR